MTPLRGMLLLLVLIKVLKLSRRHGHPSLKRHAVGFRVLRFMPSKVGMPAGRFHEKSQGKSSLVGVVEMSSQEAVHCSRHMDSFMERCGMLAREALLWLHLQPWQRLEWAASLLLDTVPIKELPPWFLEQHNLTRRDMGIDLFSLDGSRVIQCKCYNE